MLLCEGEGIGVMVEWRVADDEWEWIVLLL